MIFSHGTTRIGTKWEDVLLNEKTLRAALRFREERDWQQFHSPLNLAIAIAVEAGELLEQFQWSLPGEQRPNAEQRVAIEEEVADIAILLSYLTNDLGIDIDVVVQAKLALNARRYPVDKSRGNAVKYDRLL